MTKNKKATNKATNIKVGDVSDVSGNINIAGGNISTRQITTGLSVVEVKQLFDQLYTALESHEETSPVDKADLKAEIKEIQSIVTEAVKNNKKVDEGFLARRFRNIARMAPDILDVVVAALINPLSGLGVAAKKVAEKAKEET